jgi:hypothetical protein
MKQDFQIHYYGCIYLYIHVYLHFIIFWIMLYILYDNLLAYKHLNSEFSRSVMADKAGISSNFSPALDWSEWSAHGPTALHMGKRCWYLLDTQLSETQSRPRHGHEQISSCSKSKLEKKKHCTCIPIRGSIYLLYFSRPVKDDFVATFVPKHSALKRLYISFSYMYFTRFGKHWTLDFLDKGREMYEMKRTFTVKN